MTLARQVEENKSRLVAILVIC